MLSLCILLEEDKEVVKGAPSHNKISNHELSVGLVNVLVRVIYMYAHTERRAYCDPTRYARFESIAPITATIFASRLGYVRQYR